MTAREHTVSESTAASVPSPSLMLRGLVLDVGLPVLAYYGLHLLGASDFTALLVASAVAALRVAWTAVRRRTLNAFATVMLLVYGVGLVLALVTEDARTLLLRDSFVTASVGLVFLVTAWIGRRPLTLAASESFAPGKAAEIAQEYATNPHVRRGHRLSSTVWGAGLVAEALIRVPVVYLLPVSVAVGLSQALLVVTLVGLAVWNGWYVRRAQARGRGTAGDGADGAGRRRQAGTAE